MSTAVVLRPAPRTAPSPLPGPELASRRPAEPQACFALRFGPEPAAAAPPAAGPGPAAQHLVQALIEILEGRRSPLTVQRSTSPAVHTALVRRAAARRASEPSPERPTIRRFRAVMSTPTSCEVAAVVVLGGRVRALALRLRPHRDRWVVDAFELG